MINTTYIRPTNCINANQTLIKYCIPELISCPSQPKTGRFVACGDDWNSNIPCKQTNCEYDIPFIKGDLIQLQTIFYSGSPNNPTEYDDLIDIKLCGSDDSDKFTVVRKMSAWKDKKPYQIIEIDTTDLPNCFSFELTNLNTGEKCCTQRWGCVGDNIIRCSAQVNTDRNGITNDTISSNFVFGEISGSDYWDFVDNIEAAGGSVELVCTTPECHTSVINISGIEGNTLSYDSDNSRVEIQMNCKDVIPCEPTILIKGKIQKDCFGYCYGLPDEHLGDLIEYDNSIRLHGFIRNDIAFNIPSSSVDSVGSTTREIRELQRLVFRKMPPFMKNILMNQILSGSEICVDGVDYKLEGVEVSNERRIGNMWQFGLDVYTCCTISESNCL